MLQVRYADAQGLSTRSPQTTRRLNGMRASPAPRQRPLCGAAGLPAYDLRHAHDNHDNDADHGAGPWGRGGLCSAAYFAAGAAAGAGSRLLRELRGGRAVFHQVKSG